MKITLIAPVSKNRSLGLIFLEVSLVLFVIRVLHAAELTETWKEALRVWMVGSLFGGMYYLGFAPELKSQSLQGSVFSQRLRYYDTSHDLLATPDLVVKRDPRGRFTISYWDVTGHKIIRVLDDPQGAMQEALLRIVRSLPPEQFVDEYPSAIQCGDSP